MFSGSHSTLNIEGLKTWEKPKFGEYLKKKNSGLLLMVKEEKKAIAFIH